MDNVANYVAKCVRLGHSKTAIDVATPEAERDHASSLSP